MPARLSTVMVAVAVWYATRESVACVMSPICGVSAACLATVHLHLNESRVACEAGPLALVLLHAHLTVSQAITQ